MRLKSLITTGALVLACFALNASDTLKLEGLLYLDGSAVRISVVEGTITAIERLEESDVTRLPYIAPGLIDLQINGYTGVDFSDQNLRTEDFIKATRALWKEGITSYLPTVITADGDMLRNSFTLLASASKDPEIAASIPGFHLEGPYISPEKGFRGAHWEKYIRKPDWEEFAGLQELSGSRIRLVTVAPEMEGAIPFIRNCTRSGVLVSLGHHDGSSQQIRQAADAGASLSTHLGNGCANMIDRHNNPLWPQLAEDRLSTTLIADGFHLNKDELNCFYRMKGLERTILVSDALDLAGLPPGMYIRGEREVLLTPDVIKFPAEDVLAGAATPLSKCVSNMMDFTGCSLADAIRMASTNPAKLLGLDKLGEISPGKRADLILFYISDEGMDIRTTIVKGEIVYEK